MHETEAKSMALATTKDQLLEAFKAKLAEGIANMDAQEAGEVTDMIKDLAEADKACWESKYYQSIVEAMEEEKESEVKGYDSWRYSDGRFAPSGRGSRRGYMPPYMNGSNFYDEIEDGMMGYTEGSQNGRMANGNARQGYAGGDVIDQLADMWQQADPETKKRMKSALEEMTRALGE